MCRTTTPPGARRRCVWVWAVHVGAGRGRRNMWVGGGGLQHRRRCVGVGSTCAARAWVCIQGWWWFAALGRSDTTANACSTCASHTHTQSTAPTRARLEPGQAPPCLPRRTLVVQQPPGTLQRAASDSSWFPVSFTPDIWQALPCFLHHNATPVPHPWQLVLRCSAVSYLLLQGNDAKSRPYVTQAHLQ
jgi:hypothetical protein